MEIAAITLLGAFAYKLTDFLRYLSAKDWKSVGTQTVAWISGVVSIVLFSISDFGSDVVINGQSLGEFNYASLVILGMSASSLFGFANDALGAIDITRSSAKPGLFGD